MKSKYIQEGITNDLESYGHIETPCEVAAEFVADIVKDRGHYTFVFKREVAFLRAIIKRTVAELEYKDGTIIHEEGVTFIQQEAIGEIRYRDGWGGVEFIVMLEGGEK
jgi:hypothetical protein